VRTLVLLTVAIITAMAAAFVGGLEGGRTADMLTQPSAWHCLDLIAWGAYLADTQGADWVPTFETCKANYTRGQEQERRRDLLEGR
jgi:hypothetical protein